MSPTSRELPLGTHVNIQELYVTFGEPIKPSKSLTVHVGRTKKNAVWKSGDGQTHLWVLDPSINLFSKDLLTVYPRYSRLCIPLPRNKTQELTLTAEDLIDRCSDCSGRIPKLGNGFRLEVVATLHGFSAVPVSDAVPSVSNLPISPDDICQGIKDLQSILEFIGKYSNVLDGVVQVTQKFAKIHPIADAAVTALSIPYKLLKNEQEFHQDLKALGDVMRTLLSCLTDVRYAARCTPVKEIFMDIMKAVLEAASFIDNHLKKNRLERLTSAQFRSTLDDFKAQFGHLRDNYRDAMLTQIVVDVDDLKKTTASATEEKLLRDVLNPPKRGRLGVRCMDGTRQDVLGDVDVWIKDFDKPNILWIHGSPGAGKTTISSTIASRYSCAKFFFRRDVADLRDPTLVWRSIAFDLADLNSDVKKSVVEILQKEMKHAEHADVEQQFENLIKVPLQSNATSLSEPHLITVIDALDECSPDDKQWMQFLKTLRSWSCLPNIFKLIITSRDYPAIRKTFSDVCQHIALRTGESVDSKTSSDLQHFFTTRFAEIANRYEGSLPSDWPGSLKIGNLTEYAAGLFIWAETALGFIADGDPEERLSLISDNLGEAGANVDNLYHQILDVASNRLNNSERKTFDTVLGAIIFTKDPLRSCDLQKLFQLSSTRIQLIMDKLSPVISCRDSEELLRVCHKSFTDFLLDEKRSKTFAVDRGTHSLNLAQACLRLMNRELKFNILGLETSYCFNEDIPNRDRRIKATIPTSLVHSSLYWAEYFEECCDERLGRGDIPEELRIFVCENLLYWLEVLSLIGAVYVASRLLLLAARWIADSDKALLTDVMDASRFVVTFQEPISQSVPHIYLSALPFSPKQSAVSKHFQSRFSNSMLVLSEQMTSWPGTILHLEGHESGVCSVAFSPDGKRIVSGSEDETIRVWDAETGKSLMEPLKGHGGYVQSVAFSPDGKRIVSGSEDKTICVWDAETGKSLMEPLEGHEGYVQSVAFSPDGKRIVSGSDDKTIRVWDVETGKGLMEPLEGHEGCVLSIAFSPDGKHIVSGSDDETIRVWDAETGKSLMEPLEGHGGYVLSVAFSPDGRRIVSGSQDYTIRVWDVETGKSLMEPLEGHGDFVRSVAFSPDGKRIVSGSDDETIRVWDAETGKSLMEPLEGHGDYVQSVAFSPDGKHIVSGSENKTICVWDAEMDKSFMEPLEVHGDCVQSIAFSPDGKRIVSGSFDKTIRVWDAETGKSLMEPLEGHGDCVRSVAFSPDGKRIVSGSDDGTIRVWDAEMGKSLMEPLEGHGIYVRSVAFSPDSKHIVSGSYDQTIRVWDAETGKSLMEPLEGHRSDVLSVAFSPDGKCIVSGSFDRTVRVWDAETGKSLIEPLKGHGDCVRSVAFSPDGKRIISGSDDGTIRVWDAETGKNLMESLEGHGSLVQSVAFSPDGKRIVSGSFDKTICVWDAETGLSLMEPLEGHGNSVNSVAFSPDGKHIISGSSDNTIRIWGAEMGKSSMALTAESPVHGKETRNLAFFDAAGNPTFCDDSRLIDGWLYSRDKEPLFWVPLPCRVGLFWPRTTTIIGARKTQIDISGFMHGTSWASCQSLP